MGKKVAFQTFGCKLNFSETYKEDLSYYIRRDLNHPSIIAWSMGNETVEQLQDPEAGVKWFETLAEITREQDTTRMITCGLHPAYPRDGMEIPSSYIHVEPLISYNYRTDSFAAWHEKYPDLIWLASETKAYNENKRSNFEKISYNHIARTINGISRIIRCNGFIFFTHYIELESKCNFVFSNFPKFLACNFSFFSCLAPNATAFVQSIPEIVIDWSPPEIWNWT